MRIRLTDRRGFTLVELLVSMAIIGLLISLLLPAVQAARESGRRTSCSSNLRQLGLAAITFHDARGYLPSSVRPGGLTTSPRIAGLTFLLPYLELGQFYNRYDGSVNWFHANNLPVTSQRISTYICPSAPLPDRLDGVPESPSWTGLVACTDYAPTIGVDPRLVAAGLVDFAGPGMLPKNGAPALADVIDGLSNTTMYGESAGRPYVYRRGRQIGTLPSQRVNGGGWSRPASDFSIDGSSWDGVTSPGPCAINCTNGEDVGSSPFPVPYYGSEGTGEAYAFHTTGANFVFGDGSVHFLQQEINIRVFASLVTRAGAEIVTLPIKY